MKRILAVLMAVAVVASPSFADTRVVDQAERTIRQLIRSQSNWTQVYFSKKREKTLSTSEARVTGEGVASSRDGWGGAPFRFSVKIHRSDLRTQNAVVQFADGRKLTGKSTWDMPSPEDWNDVRISTPTWYDTLDSNRISLTGSARGLEPILVLIFDRAGKELARKSTRPNDRGIWAMAFELLPGAYRATASRGRWDTGDEVRFSVQRPNDDWGWGTGINWNEWLLGRSGWEGLGDEDRPWDEQDPALSISSPRPGQRVGALIQGSGRSSDSTVYIELERSGQTVYRTSARVSNGQWSFSTRVNKRGTYRLIVKTARGSRTEAVRFSVDL